MKIRILSGPIGSGKTTRLRRWAEAEPSARGILSPLIAGGRQFLHLPDGECRDMAAAPDESDLLSTPRYRFSAAAFRWAEGRLHEDARLQPRWLIIDEVGKLELRGEGFAPCLRMILAQSPAGNLVLVVRDSLLEAVTRHFGIESYADWSA